MTEETKRKSIYELDLHESTQVNISKLGETDVTRVPEGWLYAWDFGLGRNIIVTFVPFDDEMKFLLANKK